jgi:hypothetical protein
MNFPAGARIATSERPIMRNHPSVLCTALLLVVLFAGRLNGAIAINGVTDKTKYDNSITFTVNADPNAASTTATLDGTAIPVGSGITVTSVQFHELKAESRSGTGAIVDSRLVRFIVRNSTRGGTEDGIPSHTPFRVVNDAPSAFAAARLKVIAPAAWPVGLPLPIAAVLRDGADEPLRLNGLVTFQGLPQSKLQLRRGWGSITVPPIDKAGALELGANVNGIETATAVSFEANPTFQEVSGTIASNTSWPLNSRIRVTGNLTINAGAKLTVGAGSIVLISTGTTNGTAAELIVNGTLEINGVEGNPVVLAPATAGGKWGGIELPSSTSVVDAEYTIFTGSGEDENWFDTNGSYGGSSHRSEQPLFLVVGSGSGTSIGAQLHLNNCYSFDLAGQQMNSKTNTWIDLSRTLMQRCITCGELNGTKVTIDRSALIEFPSEDPTFVDGDNDAIYLTNGDLSITNTVVGFTKDDGVDSGGNGGNSPFGTIDPLTGNTVTRFTNINNWYEGTFHEGNSLSGTRNVSHTGCVFLNCGQGVEAGYSASAGGDGPNAMVDRCLFVSNMVGARWGDNYGSGYNYNGTMEVKNSFLLNNLYRDVWSYHWLTTVSNGWVYLDATTANSFGKPFLNVHDNFVTQFDSLHHPTNTLWTPERDGNLLAQFMPVPGSNVGVAVSAYGPDQADPTTYPGQFTVRLSTFSAKTVAVDWAVLGKVDPLASNSTTLASGKMTFAPGETLKTISAPLASPASYGLIHVDLREPVNAEVTGEGWYFRAPDQPDPTLVPVSAGGWRYRETRSEPPASWKNLNFDDSSPAATEWLPCTLPAGFGISGVTFGTTVNPGAATDRTKAFYFRKKFKVESPAKVRDLTLRVRRDDAAVIWLNGEALPSVISADGTFNPPYSYDATTIASGNVPSCTNTSVYITYTVPAAKLVAGDNVIAIQLHQTSITSSDLILDCELKASYFAPFELQITKSGDTPVLWWFDDAWTLEESLDLQTWIPVPGAKSPMPFSTIVPSRFFRLRK